MSSAQDQRIQTNCKLIWGDADYDFDIETSDCDGGVVKYACVVKKDNGPHVQQRLTMTGMCNSKEKAWGELDRMLDLWARQIQSGQPMTTAQMVEIFGGPNGRKTRLLGSFLDQAKKRGIIQ